MDSTLILSLEKQKCFYGSFVKLISPAKINLYLNITGDYGKGYHSIESIVERISLFDQITLRIIKEPIIKLTCNDKNLETESNLCVKAAKLIKEKYNLPFGFFIYLKKNIPVGSGLGGGSSNAATVLIGLKALLNLDLNREQLYKLGACLGSDVNFFLAQSPYAFIYGRGEKVIPFTASKLKHNIIWPKVFLSTKDVYKNTNTKLTSFFNNVNILRYALKCKDIKVIENSIFNILEKSALSLCGKMLKVKKEFEKYNIFAKVTGSGSALYTFGNLNIPNSIKRLSPSKWLIFRVQTF